MDAPSHCYEDNLSIDKIPLSSLICHCRVIDVSDKADEHYGVSAEDIYDFEERYGAIPDNALDK